MSKLTNKTAFVTGASKGLGAAIAKELAGAGATVIVNYSSGKAGADKVVADIVAAGGKAESIQGDFRSRRRSPRSMEKSRNLTIRSTFW